MASGTVLSLHRWPVKSLGGEQVAALRIDPRGVGGDRTHALFDLHRGAPRRLTARQAPRMLAWAAAYPAAPDDLLDPAAPPLPHLTAPDGRAFTWDDPQLPIALASDLGRDVALHRDLGGQQDLGDSVLVTTTGTLEALGEELGQPLDLRRFRTNVHVALDAPPFAEEQWEGRRIRIGAAELDLLHPCERCVIPTRDPDSQEKWAPLLKHLAREHRCLFGINARPVAPARIAVGDAVRVA